jgi:hypothetical protein
VAKKGLIVKAKEFKTDFAVAKDLQVSIGRVFEESARAIQHNIYLALTENVLTRGGNTLNEGRRGR